nr:retrovirus-related Pol polyprotein from transposon TNT 1-94 [Tanacetum cinerariifolium]
EKKAKLFNEWERFTSNEGESIESYLKRNKHFPEKIASNLKFLNNLQPEWSRHVTIVHQTKDLHTADYTQLYDFLKYNQKEVDELKAKRLAKTQDPLALMANSNNPYAFPAPHQDQPSAFKLNYSTPTNNNQRISSNPRNRQIAQPGNPAGYNDVIGNQVIQNAVQNLMVQNVGNPNGLIGVQGNRNQNQIGNGNLVAARAEGNAAGQNGNQIRCYNCRGVGHYARNYTVRPKRRFAAYLQTQLLIAHKEEFLGTVRFGNDHFAAILGFGDLQWGNILITMVYFVEGLGHNLFSVGQFCDSDIEVAFRRNACFVRNLEGVDLLKGDRSTNLYTINLHEMASASPICLMARASSTKSWLWHQRLSHLNFDTISDLARNDLVAGLTKFKYHKEHLCPSCEQGKSNRASHPPKPVLNSRQRLHLLYIDLCGPMRIASINGKRYILVIVDDYSRYTWVHFLRSKDEA